MSHSWAQLASPFLPWSISVPRDLALDCAYLRRHEFGCPLEPQSILLYDHFPSTIQDVFPLRLCPHPVPSLAPRSQFLECCCHETYTIGANALLRACVGAPKILYLLRTLLPQVLRSFITDMEALLRSTLLRILVDDGSLAIVYNPANISMFAYIASLNLTKHLQEQILHLVNDDSSFPTEYDVALQSFHAYAQPENNILPHLTQSSLEKLRTSDCSLRTIFYHNHPSCNVAFLRYCSVKQCHASAYLFASIRSCPLRSVGAI